MNKGIILFISLLFFGTAFSQPPNHQNRKDKEGKIHRQKIAFMSTELNLGTEEAQKFWPIYNEYEAELKVIRDKRREYHSELKKIDNLSGERAYELTESLFKLDGKENDLRLTYLGKFAKVLGKKKAAHVFMAEEMFKRQLLKDIKGNGRKPGGRPNGPPQRH